MHSSCRGTAGFRVLIRVRCCCCLDAVLCFVLGIRYNKTVEPSDKGGKNRSEEGG